MSSSFTYATDVPLHVQYEIEARAFRKLVAHFAERSDSVSNIDTMALTGFCRNCLGKWVTVASHEVALASASSLDPATASKLAAATYDEMVGQVVYGEPYDLWKKKHNKKATELQMQKYEESKSMHAAHDKSLLSPVALPVPPSDVCCTDVDACTPPSQRASQQSSSAISSPAIPIPIPTFATPTTVSVKIVTVSDRASQGLYPSGDLSGPSVEKAISSFFEANHPALGALSLGSVERVIVPDEESAIVDALKRNQSAYQFVITTGGTGFGNRDVTPEATRTVIEKDCTHLLVYASGVLSQTQPLAVLSRGVAGTVNGGKGMIINLPGSPNGAREFVEVVMPGLMQWLNSLNN
jgi:gephyrin